MARALARGGRRVQGARATCARFAQSDGWPGAREGKSWASYEQTPAAAALGGLQLAKEPGLSQAASWADITLKLAVYGADFAPRLDTLTQRMLRALTNCGETPLFLAARAGHMSVTPVPAWVHAELPRSGAPHGKTPDDDLPKSKAARC